MLPVGGCARCGARCSCLTGPAGADGSAAGFFMFLPGNNRRGWAAAVPLAGLGNTAEEEVANISHDSGAARGNAVLGDQDEEAREHVVDFAGSFKFL